MANFLISYKKTGGNEGGYSFVDGDKGGMTYCGVSRKWFPNWEGWKIVDAHQPLKRNQIIDDDNLKQMVQEFYREQFWNKINGDSIPLQDTADQTYDTAVNCGVHEALKLLNES